MQSNDPSVATLFHDNFNPVLTPCNESGFPTFETLRGPGTFLIEYYEDERHLNYQSFKLLFNTDTDADIDCLLFPANTKTPTSLCQFYDQLSALPWPIPDENNRQTITVQTQTQPITIVKSSSRRRFDPFLQIAS